MLSGYIYQSRIRVKEADIDQQVMAVFDKMRVEDEKVRDWFRLVLASFRTAFSFPFSCFPVFLLQLYFPPTGGLSLCWHRGITRRTAFR